MAWIIVKWWPGVVESVQQATQKQFGDKAEAERIKALLQADFSGREFAVREIPRRPIDLQHIHGSIEYRRARQPGLPGGKHYGRPYGSRDLDRGQASPQPVGRVSHFRHESGLG